MKLSSNDLLELNIIDEIIEEPVGGAHRDKDKILNNVKISIEKSLVEFSDMSREDVFEKRKNKFLSMGRSKGLYSSGKNKDKLVLQTNIVNEIIQKFNTNKINYIVLIGIIIIMVLFGLLI